MRLSNRISLLTPVQNAPLPLPTAENPNQIPLDEDSEPASPSSSPETATTLATPIFSPPRSAIILCSLITSVSSTSISSLPMPKPSHRRDRDAIKPIEISALLPLSRRVVDLSSFDTINSILPANRSLVQLGDSRASLIDYQAPRCLSSSGESDSSSESSSASFVDRRPSICFIEYVRRNLGRGGECSVAALMLEEARPPIVPSRHLSRPDRVLVSSSDSSPLQQTAQRQ